MRNTMAIARRQFASYFNGPVAYIVLCAVLLVFGFFFWRTFFLYQVASVRQMVIWLPLMLLVAAPALTMGLLAEEKRTGTIELLLTMPVRDSEVILGKFLGVLALYGVLLLLTIPYPVSVASLGNLDAGPVLTAYLGLFLTGAAMLAIGLMFSSFTSNQIVAFFASAFVCFVLWLLDKILPFIPSGILTDVAAYMAIDKHLQDMARGVIDTRDVIYFVSLTGFALLLGFRGLESRRWR
jgi:ABC-2 type transport system permease protein